MLFSLFGTPSRIDHLGLCTNDHHHLFEVSLSSYYPFNWNERDEIITGNRSLLMIYIPLSFGNEKLPTLSLLFGGACSPLSQHYFVCSFSCHSLTKVCHPHAPCGLLMVHHSKLFWWGELPTGTGLRSFSLSFQLL